MAKILLKRELQPIKEGMPYTWGTGEHFYVLLGGTVHSIGTGGILPKPKVIHLMRNLDGFRYATAIEIKD